MVFRIWTLNLNSLLQHYLMFCFWNLSPSPPLCGHFFSFDLMTLLSFSWSLNIKVHQGFALSLSSLLATLSFGNHRYFHHFSSHPMQTPASGVCGVVDAKNKHRLWKSFGEKGRARPLSERESISTLAWTGFYCFLIAYIKEGSHSSCSCLL